MEDNRRRATSVRQLELLIHFMEGHKDFALGRVRSKEARAVAVRLWERCSELLNAEGASRTPKEWSRVWNDYKCRVRSKLSEINRGHKGTGGGPNMAVQMTPLEDRVATLIGRDAGPLTGVRRDPVMDTSYEVIEEVEVPNESMVLQHNSATLDLISIINEMETGHEANSPQHSPVIGSRTPSIGQTEIVERVDQPLSQSRHTLSQSVDRSRNREPSRAHPQVHPRAPAYSIHQSNVALDETRASIARIEETRARTEELAGQANLRQAEAAVQHAEAMASIAHSLRIIAESVQSYTNELRNNH